MEKIDASISGNFFEESPEVYSKESMKPHGSGSFVALSKRKVGKSSIA
jgi:hypothetical protein